VARLVGEGYGEQDFAALITMQAKAAGVDLEKRSALTGAKPPQTVAARGQITVPAPEDARKGGN